MAKFLRIPPDKTINPERPASEIKPLSKTEESYEWLLKLIDGYDIKGIKLYDIRNYVANYKTHVSMYHSDAKDKPAYMRIYWPLSGKAKYYKVDDFDELRENNKELTDLLLRNGEYAFLSANDPDACFEVYRST